MFPGRRTPDGKIDTRRIEVIDDLSASVMRRMSPAKKIEMIDAMARQAWLIIESNVRSMHPDWPEPRVRQEIVRRFSSGAA
jgi:hypothetical protein